MAYSYTVDELRSGPIEVTYVISENNVDPATSVVEIDIGAPDRALTLCTLKSLLNIAGGATTLQPEISASAGGWFGQLQYRTATAGAPIYDQTFTAIRAGSDGKIYLKTKPDVAQSTGGNVVTYLKIRYGWKS